MQIPFTQLLKCGIVTINLHLVDSDYIVQIVLRWLPALSDIGTLQHKCFFVEVRVNIESIICTPKKD